MLSWFRRLFRVEKDQESETLPAQLTDAACNEPEKTAVSKLAVALGKSEYEICMILRDMKMSPETLEDILAGKISLSDTSQSRLSYHKPASDGAMLAGPRR